jgi:4-amino-4-deoxy-L-arabinose transferase-like glycosyltransferase
MTSRISRPILIAGLLILIVGVGAVLRLWAIDRLPPQALDPDQGYYGADSLTILHGQWMVYSPRNTGREALFMTLAAGVFKLFGPSVLTFHVFAAVLGVLTLPAIFWLGWEASPEREWAPWLGLLAAASVTGLLTHVILNRQGQRVNMQPLFTAATMAALLHALRVQRRGWFILAGVLLGLSGYTYVTVRLLPLVVLSAWAIWWPRERWRSHAVSLFWVAGIAALVYIPLAVYFLSHPGLFLGRAQALFDPSALGRSIWSTLLIFHFKGDPVLTNNLPGRPLFDAAQALAFWIGAVVALTGRGKREGRLMLVWFVVGVIPSALARDAPSYIHAFGIIPPLGVLMGGGYLRLGRWLAERLRPRLPALAALIGISAIVFGLLYSVARTYADYFVRWANRTDLSLAYRFDLKRIDDLMRALPPDTEVFYSPHSFVESPLEFYRGGDLSRLHPYNGNYCVPLGDASQHPLAYFANDPLSMPALRTYFPGGSESVVPEFSVFLVPAGTPPRFDSLAAGQATWAEEYQLARAEWQAADSQNLTVQLVWQTRGPGSGIEYHRFVHLLSDDTAQPGGVRLWAQSDDLICRSTHAPHYWQTGEYIAETIELKSAERLPTGRYRLAVGLYQQGAPVRLAVSAASWPVVDDTVTFAAFTVP